jgi:hypothetical protein
MSSNEKTLNESLNEGGMDLRELRLRISPWLALLMGAIFLTWQLIEKRSRVTFGDLYPGISLLVASGVLFWVVKRIFNSSSQSEEGDSSISIGSDAPPK